MRGREIADSGLQLERIVRVVARKGSIVEVAGNSTGVINKPHSFFLSKGVDGSRRPVGALAGYS